MPRRSRSVNEKQAPAKRDTARPASSKRSPTAPPATSAADADGRPIKVGQLVENLANHDDFGRVTHVLQNIVVYRQLGSPDISGHNRDDLCTWQNDELRVVEDSPVVPLPPAAAAAIDLAHRLAAIKSELELADSVASPGETGCKHELQEAQEGISQAIDSMTTIFRLHVGDADAATGLANAIDPRKGAAQ